MTAAGRAFDPEAVDLADLRSRQSAKYRTYPEDVLPAWVAEMDFPLAAPVAQALHDAIDRSDTGYRSGIGVAEALADFARRSWEWAIDPGRVVVIPDVLTGIAQSLLTMTAPGDGVVVTSPVYPPFYVTVAQISGRTVVDVPMVTRPDGTSVLDVVGLAEAFARPDVTAFLLCSPHNPTGSVPSREELVAVAALAEQHGVLVIADEIHAPLTLPGATHVPYLPLVADDVAAVSLVSASKAWNIPGLKCAQLVATGAAFRRLRAALPAEALFGTGHLGVIGAVAAYRDGGPWLAEVLSVLDRNRWLLRDLLADRLPLARYVPPAASYLAWLDLRAYDAGDDPARVLLARGRVALSSGPPFGPAGRGHARLNLATSPALVTEAVRRMAGALESR